MGIKDYFGYGRPQRGGAGKGYQQSKREYNDTKTPAQKEKKYKNVLNIFSRIRNKSNPEDKEDTIAVTDIEDFSASGDFGGVLDVYNSYVYSVENSKGEKLAIYREMAKYPEISFAVDEYVDEAINPDDEDKIMGLIIKSDAIKDNDNIVRTLEAEWDHLFYDIIEVNKYAVMWFRDFIIDAEIMLEKRIDTESPEKGLIGAKKLRTSKCHPIWDDLETDEIAQFVYKTESSIMYLDTEMIAYANSGDYEYNQAEDDKVILGLLEPAKTTYRRLKQLEDALVIYRLVRAPERRVFNIEVGELPKGKAEQYMRDLITKYRQRKFYNQQTGEVSEALDVMAMTEDFWFPVFRGGKHSSVDTLPAGENLGEMDDVEYFLKKLYRSLKVPISRFEADTGFSLGDTSDITREEVKFKKQVKYYSSRFVEIFKQMFMTHLDLKGIKEEYGISVADFTIDLFSLNLFDEFMAAKVQEMKFAQFEKVSGMIDDQEPIISKEIALKHYLEMDDDLYIENEKLLAAERAAGVDVDDDAAGGEFDEGAEEEDLGL